MNLVRGRVERAGDVVRLVTPDGWALALEAEGLVGVEVVLGVRPNTSSSRTIAVLVQ
jgi:hypothetical protein